MSEHTPLRVLIVEDREDRQAVLRSLFREHAWILTHTAERAATLVGAYRFDLIALDYDLAGPGKGLEVAEAIAGSPSPQCDVWIHSMNDPGARRIVQILPQAKVIPFSQLTKSNTVVKRIREALRGGTNVDWAVVFRKGE